MLYAMGNRYLLFIFFILVFHESSLLPFLRILLSLLFVYYVYIVDKSFVAHVVKQKYVNVVYSGRALSYAS